MPSVENVLDLFRKESKTPFLSPEVSAQHLMSNPAYVGDQLAEKKEIDDKAVKQNKQNDNSYYKKAKQIYFFETSTHFLDRMKQRDISEEQIKDVLKEGFARIQNKDKGTVMFTKDSMGVVLDILKRKLVTVMHLNPRESSLYSTVSEIEDVVLSMLDE